MDKQVTKIALVDDHSLLRGSLASLINSFEGYSVLFEADNGRDFIEALAHNETPDIILLDVTMPEMNGFETAAWVRKNLASTKVLVLSMMDDETAIIAMLKEGARGYILKDSKPAVFRQALDDIRDKGFFMNDLVSNKMLNYVTNEEGKHPGTAITQLTERETVFLKLACSEKTYKEIAQEMHLSPRTVEGYRDDLFKKLNVVSRVGLVMFAIKSGIHKL